MAGAAAMPEIVIISYSFILAYGSACKMKEGRWFTFALFSTFFIALTLRLILPLEFNVWGPDTGENYFISNFLATNGSMPHPYYGFGTTYTEFPSVYLLIATVARAGGVSTAAALELTMPFVTSLLVFPVAGIALTLTSKRSVAIFSSLFYATSVVIIGHTSIISSDTLGEVILVFFIYFYLSSRRNRLMTALAMLSALAMIPTYHLGTVLLLLFLYASLFYYSFFKREDSGELLKSLFFTLTITTLTWVYWLAFAPVFLSNFILKNPQLSLEAAISTPYLLVFLIFIIGSFANRKPSRNEKVPHMRIRTEYFAAALAVGVTAVTYLSIVGAESVPLYPSAYTLLNIPTVVVTLLGFVVLVPALNGDRRIYPLGLTVIAIGLIMVVGLLTNIAFLVPERLVEFLLLFIATFAGIGMVGLIERSRKDARAAVTIALSLALVLAGGFSTAFVTKTTTPSKIGATPAGDLSATLWLKFSSSPGSTVASDHRLSSIIFGFAQRNATWEKGGYPIFTAGSLSSLEASLNMTITPSGQKTVGYLLTDTYMVNDANFYPNQTAIPVSPAVLSGLRSGDFILLYSNGFASVYGYAP